MNPKIQDIAECIASAAMAELEKAIGESFGCGFDAGYDANTFSCGDNFIEDKAAALAYHMSVATGD